MATIARNCKIGDIVYPHAMPRKAGKIISIQKEVASIRQVDGTIYEAHIITLKDFKALVEETEEKAMRHRYLLDQLLGA